MQDLEQKKRLLTEVNRPPALTWKHLGVNGTVLALQNEGPSPKLKLSPEFAAVPTGMGRAVENFIEEHSGAPALWEVPAGSHPEPKILRQELQGGQSRAEMLLIHAAAGSRLTLVQVQSSAGAASAQYTSLTKIIAEAGAQILLIQLQLLNSQSISVQDVGVQLGEKARVQVCQAELGGAKALAGCMGILAGRGSDLAVQTFYFGDGRRQLDFNYVARHVAARTHSELEASGLLLGASDKIYRGTLDFQKGSVQARGREREETLLFSPRARNRTVPLMLCAEENVEGHHAATIGRLDAAKLFYLQSRGLDLNQIKNLAVQARFAPLWEMLPARELREQVQSFLQRRIISDGKMGSC